MEKRIKREKKSWTIDKDLIRKVIKEKEIKIAEGDIKATESDVVNIALREHYTR